MRVRFLRTACPACWLLDVSRLIASRMVFRAQGESPAPRSWERRATCSRRVVRRVCSELIMWYRKLTILDRISKRHSRPLDVPLAPLARLELPLSRLSRASRLPSRAPRTSLSRASRLPSRAPRDSSGTFKSRLEKRVGARGERLVVGRVAARAARRPSPSPLGGASGRRATTVRAPLPVGYLPISKN